MEDDTLDKIADELESLLPMVFKKIMKPNKDDMEIELSRMHLDIMFILNKFAQLTMSDIAKRLLISKPYNTLLVDRLIEPVQFFEPEACLKRNFRVQARLDIRRFPGRQMNDEE